MHLLLFELGKGHGHLLYHSLNMAPYDTCLALICGQNVLYLFKEEIKSDICKFCIRGSW